MNNNITIYEYKEKKQKLQDAIFDLLMNFSKETGAVITDVNISNIATFTSNPNTSNSSPILYLVSVDCAL